jgi:hypothetical protein
MQIALEHAYVQRYDSWHERQTRSLNRERLTAGTRPDKFFFGLMIKSARLLRC